MRPSLLPLHLMIAIATVLWLSQLAQGVLSENKETRRKQELYCIGSQLGELWYCVRAPNAQNMSLDHPWSGQETVMRIKLLGCNCGYSGLVNCRKQSSFVPRLNAIFFFFVFFFRMQAVYWLVGRYIELLALHQVLAGKLCYTFIYIHLLGATIKLSMLFQVLGLLIHLKEYSS